MRPQMPMGNPQGLSILNPQQFRPQGIGSYLGPLLGAIQRDYHQDKIEPYVQDVENLTTQTFPDFDLGGGGGMMPPRPIFQPPQNMPQPGIGGPVGDQMQPATPATSNVAKVLGSESFNAPGLGGLFKAMGLG